MRARRAPLPRTRVAAMRVHEALLVERDIYEDIEGLLQAGVRGMKPEAHLCPVCGFDALIRPPRSHMICPCCGTQFDYDDVLFTLEDLRWRWLASGPEWWSHSTPPPPGWRWQEQLARVGGTDRFKISGLGAMTGHVSSRLQHPAGVSSFPIGLSGAKAA